jgi:hypothetical protein
MLLLLQLLLLLLLYSERSRGRRCVPRSRR